MLKRVALSVLGLFWATLAFAQSASIQVFDDVAALTAAPPPGTSTTAYLRGYYVPGDGGSGMLNWNATSGTPDQCQTFASSSGGSAGLWVRNLPDATITVLQCGAKADGSASGGIDTGDLSITGTDNSPFFTAAIATQKHVFAPCGSYVLNSTLAFQNRGQNFQGSNPDSAGCATILIAGTGIGSGNLLSLGTSSGAGTWGLELDHFSIDGRAMIATPGAYTANEIFINIAVHPYIHDIRTSNAWNGIQLNNSNSVDLARINNVALRGDYNEYCTNNTQIVEIMDSNNTAISAKTVTTTSIILSGATTIPISSTKGIWKGMIATGSANIPDGAKVTAVTANVSVTLSAPTGPGSIASGTTLVFDNQTFGFYMGDYCASVLAQYVKTQEAFHAIEINSPTGAHVPNGFDCFRCGGDIMRGTILHDVNGTQVKITQFYGVVGSNGDTLSDAVAGPAVYQGPNAGDLQLLNSTVAGGRQEGIYVAGSQFRLIGGIIGRNSAGTPHQYCGITFASTATDAIVSSASIGEYHNGHGNQKYGICSNSSNNQQNLLINGNDLRYNDYGPVDDPAKYTLGTNTGLGTANALLDPSTVYLTANLSGSYSAAHIMAIDTAIRSLKSAGIWGATDWIAVSLGNSQDSLTNWIAPASGNFAVAVTPPAINGTVTYAAGPAAGFTSNGTTGWINLNFPLTSVVNCQLNSCAMFVGSNTNPSGTANSYDLTSTTSHNSSIIGQSLSGLIVHANATTFGTDTLASTAAIYGWSRTASNAYKTYAAGSPLSSHTDASSSVGAGNMGLLGDGTNFSTRQNWFSWIGGLLTDTQAAQLNTIVNTLKTSW